MIPIDEALFRLILKLEINLFLCGMLLFVFFLFQVQIAKTCMVIKMLSLDEPIFFSPRFSVHCHCHKKDSRGGMGGGGV